ncbi:MAG: SEC-C domain-containing protein, partial [Treponema sp.]|nr:SEC-C domain-containing protein [Treponema sp.]
MLFTGDNITKESVIAALQNDLTEKATLAGSENLNMFIRYQYIQSIDKKWLDQLETLESLREGVSLRSYGSKNPLTEYKIDGFNIFYDMLDTIRAEIVSRIFKVRIQVNPAVPREQKAPQQVEATHSQAQSSFNGDQAHRDARGSAMQKATTGAGVTVRRTMEKVGRNDPCPCGSGKKYKNCCGRNA